MANDNDRRHTVLGGLELTRFHDVDGKRRSGENVEFSEHQEPHLLVRFAARLGKNSI